MLAAGGIADGRTLAGALVLGDDGALVGSRLWATQECLAPQGAKDVALITNGDGTARTAISAEKPAFAVGATWDHREQLCGRDHSLRMERPGLGIAFEAPTTYGGNA